VAVLIQHLAEKIAQHSPTFAILQAAYPLNAPTRAQRTQSALAPMRGSSCCGRETGRDQSITNPLQRRHKRSAGKAELHPLQRHGSLLCHQRKELKIHPASPRHIRKVENSSCSLAPHVDGINLEVRCSPQITTWSTATFRAGIRGLFKALRITPAQL